MKDLLDLLPRVALILMLVAAGGLGGSILGWRTWRIHTKALDDYIDLSDKPEEMSNRYYRHVVRSARRRKRLIRTILWSILGVALGLVAVFAFALFKRR